MRMEGELGEVWGGGGWRGEEERGEDGVEGGEGEV